MFRYQLKLSPPIESFPNRSVPPQALQRWHVMKEKSSIQDHGVFKLQQLIANVVILRVLPGDVELVAGVHQDLHALDNVLVNDMLVLLDQFGLEQKIVVNVRGIFS